MTFIIHTVHGAFCTECGAVLGQEEIDFDCCDCCGGEGLGDPDDDLDDDFQIFGPGIFEEPTR